MFNFFSRYRSAIDIDFLKPPRKKEPFYSYGPDSLYEYVDKYKSPRNPWRIAFWIVILLATAFFTLYTREHARRVIAETPCSISRALVVLKPGGYLRIDEVHADVSVISWAELQVFYCWPHGLYQQKIARNDH